MGEQPKPVEDEVDRALTSMRAGFLLAAEQIVAGLTSLQQHLVDVPAEEQGALQEHVTRLASAHKQITGKVTQLPPPSWDSFRIMVAVVKAQQTVLDQVGLLVQQHVLPRQLETLTVAPRAAAPAQLPEQPAETKAPRLMLHHNVPPDDSYLPIDDPRHDNGFRPGVPEASPARSALVAGQPAAGFPTSDNAPRRRRAAADDDDPDAPEPTMWALARERTAGFRGLAAMVIVGVILSILPRDRLQDAGARVFDLLSPSRESVSDGRVSPVKVTVAAAPRSADRIPSAGEAAAVTAVGPAPSAAALAADGDGRFVPVVFTHKDRATVAQALADLKQQYPRIMVGRQGQVQPVDLGSKGTWHRLVVLPAGSPAEAAKLCDQLAAEGYDRCSVKAY